MAELTNINPYQRVLPQERSSERRQQVHEEQKQEKRDRRKQEQREQPDDGQPHIDEYA